MDGISRVPAGRIAPLHGVRDGGKLAELVASMQRDGWTGRPVLACDDGNGLHAWTGSHRIAAAVAAGVDVPVLVMAPPSWSAWTAAGFGDDDGFGDCRDDEERLAQLAALPGYEAAVLMAEECR